MPGATETPETWRPAIRADVGRLRKVERTASGGIRVPAAVAREGVLTYQRADGTVVRELVPGTELEHAESLATLRDAPITIGHPDGGARMVSPATYRRDSVGHVSGVPRMDGGHIVADLAIQDDEAIRRIDAGELREISAGYRVMIDPTPGVFQGERYDAVQRRRTYNHAALLPAGAGRAGATVALRVDEKDVDVAWEARIDASPATPPSEGRTDSMSTIRIDGIDYKVGSSEHAQAQERFNTRLTEERDKAVARADQAEAARDQAVEERDKARKSLEEATTPARLDALLTDRLALVEGARKVLGAEWKHDGKDEATIIAETLKKAAPKLDLEGKSDAYKRARFDAIVEVVGEGGDDSRSTITKARADAFSAPPAGNGGGFVSPHFDGREPPPNLATSHRKAG